MTDPYCPMSSGFLPLPFSFLLSHLVRQLLGFAGKRTCHEKETSSPEAGATKELKRGDYQELEEWLSGAKPSSQTETALSYIRLGVKGAWGRDTDCAGGGAPPPPTCLWVLGCNPSTADTPAHGPAKLGGLTRQGGKNTCKTKPGT